MSRERLITVIDTETTGSDTTKDQVIEIAAAVVDVESRTIIQSFATLVAPLTIPDGAENDISLLNPVEEINHIPPQALLLELVENPELFIIRQMMERSHAVVAHNAAFDKPMTQRLFEGRQIVFPSTPWICSVKDLVFPHQRSSRILTHLATDHHIATGGAHRALADVCMLSSLLFVIENLEEQLRHALEPKDSYYLDPQVSFQNKDRAKELGFSWSSEQRLWKKDLTNAEVATIKALDPPFPITKDRAN